MSNNDPWPEAKAERLRVLWAEGYSASEIGGVLNVSKNAVIGKAHRLGLPGRASPIVAAKPKAPTTTNRRWARAVKVLPLPPALMAAMEAEKAERAAERQAVVSLSRIVAAVTEEERPKGYDTVFKPVVRACCWPMWKHDQKPTHQYCEAVAVSGKAYCPAHHRIAYTAVTNERADLTPWLPNRQGVQGGAGVGFV